MLATKNSITFLGDIYLPESYRVDVSLNNYVANLEFPITKSGFGMPGKINLKANDNHFLSTFKCKPLALCLANNHIADYGEKGFDDTLINLRDLGVKYFGAGTQGDNCNNPIIVQVSNIRIGLLAYVCDSTSPISVSEENSGVAVIDIERIKNDMKLAKSKGAEKIVVSFHWGAEHVEKPKVVDVKTARSVVDMGADLVIGHHSHCIQSWEKYNGKYIFYGLGNCIFPDFTANSYYDEITKKPTSSYSYKQKYWNKTSLAVDFNPVTDEVTAYKLRFDGNVLKQRSLVKLKNYRIDLDRDYSKEFKKNYALCKLRSVLFNWLANPKFPKLRHFRGIVQVLTNKKYK